MIRKVDMMKIDKIATIVNVFNRVLFLFVVTTSFSLQASETNIKKNAALGKQEKSATEILPDLPLEKFRSPFKVITERAIGSTSKRVRYDWRRGTLQVAASASHLAELNNFESNRLGAVIRIPSDNLLFEMGLSRVWIWETTSTKRLARTPYRQPGRPERFEIDAGIVYPLAEGVVTSIPGFFPAVQMVFNAYGNARYHIYPDAYKGIGWKQNGKNILKIGLTADERENLEEIRLPAMEIDKARYGIMAGLGTDFYFQSGLFVSSKVLLSLPWISQTKLVYWYELGVAAGIGF